MCGQAVNNGVAAAMGKALPVFILVAILVAVNARDVELSARSRMRRGFSNGGLGGSNGSSGSGYGRGSDEQDASVSREGIGGCSGESGRGYGGRSDLAFNRDGRSSNENHRGGRSFSKASASASAVASTINQNQNQPVA